MTRTLLLTTLALAALASAAFANGRKPGSVGIFPIQAHGSIDLQVDSPEGVPAFTVVSVTNTNTTPVFGETLVHFEYVNIVVNFNNVFMPLGCVVFDRVELLTPADTLAVLTQCHNPGPAQRGYLVVSAQDPNKFDTPWDFDYLIGSELVLTQTGLAFQLNMIPFEALVGPGLETDLGGGQGGGPANGRLDFDGREYEEIPDKLYIDSFVAFLRSELVLLNLTGGGTARNTLLFSIWNDNEFPLSTTLTFNCWFHARLETISPLFTQNFLANNTPDDPAELDLSCVGVMPIETGWAIIDSIDVSVPGGQQIASDGAVLGAIITQPPGVLSGGRLLWESDALQDNGSFVEP